MKKYLKIMRIDHWIKQFFIFPGFIFALLLTNKTVGGGLLSSNLIIKTIIGFFSTCFIASANYVINEWLDAEFDKYHPIKKYRAVVQEDVKAKYVYLIYFALTLLGFILALQINIPFFLMELWLWIMGILYNVKPFRTKDLFVLDVLSESVNNAIRLLIGWFIVVDNYLPPVSIVIGYWFVGAFLMDVKRYAEYRMINDKSLASLYRKSFAYYSEEKLLCLALFYAMTAIFFVGVFLVKYRVEFVLIIPFLILLFVYYLHMSFKKDSAAQAPEKLYKEKTLMIIVGIVIVLFIVLTHINIPQLYGLLSTELIKIPWIK